ncbi:ABC transporter ATP-binding protein [Antarcticimicrobium sediminis]|uniref:ABC transporter ATP-binding protein n=1 Tax=Antarcticimicrobium sediminis TaxID=2546227 RepID=A0A4R5EKD1_9RHOB|nr:ABC transporter ATP-binding protein [Antarcticimicrobium sediminis]TDE34800.1 ABC transporter ATP-binding protein [Antarcticimicrobium sediminis]
MFDTAKTETKLELDGVTSGYGPIAIIKDLSLSIRKGEIFALMGKNGMGKTTLLKTILGLVSARSGEIQLDGRSIVGASPKALIKSGVGYAPQEQPLFTDLSIQDNLRLAIRSDRDLGAALEHVFTHFPFLRDRLAQQAGTLSGGEQKMLILSRALMLKPDLILIDEISEGLQPTVIAQIAKALQAEQAENGTTILLVEQNLNFALDVADRWAVLKLGEIDDSGIADADSRERVLEHLKI